MALPGLRLHPLKGELSGHFAVSISGNSGNDVFGLLNTAADSVNGGGGNDVLFGTTKDVVKNIKTIIL